MGSKAARKVNVMRRRFMLEEGIDKGCESASLAQDDDQAQKEEDGYNGQHPDLLVLLEKGKELSRYGQFAHGARFMPLILFL